MSCSGCVYPPPPIIVSQLAVAQLPTFGISIPNTAPVIAAGFLHNGLNWDPDAPLIQGTVATSQLWNATAVTAGVTNYGARGVIVIVNVTVVTGAGSFNAYIQSQDPVSGNWITLTGTNTAMTVVSSYAFELSPGASGASPGLPGITNRWSGGLPRIWRIQMVKNSGTSINASIGYQYVR